MRGWRPWHDRVDIPLRLRERAVRLVREHGAEHPSQWAAIASIAGKLGCTAETLRKWVRQAERDAGMRGGLTTAEHQRVKELEREVRELKRAHEILRKASAFFAQADRRADRPLDLVDRHFTATQPNQLWGAAFTYVATWQGVVYVAFVIDVFARRIVGWRVAASLHTDFVLDALEQALYDRRGNAMGDLVHHSDSEYMGACFRAA